MAALTRRIKLATGAVIVPWNLQPLRVPEHHGKYLSQLRAPLRPGPLSNAWRETRFTQVAMSPDSAEETARLGAQKMAFNHKPPVQMKQKHED